MNKTIKLVYMCLVANFLPAHAEVTDISGMEDVVYINPVSVTAGSECVLSVKMKNSVPMESFGFDLVLPEGITVATDEDGFPLAELSTERTTARKTDVFSANFKPDGSLNVQAYSNNKYTISGNDGEVALITINISSTLEAGDYPIILKNISMGDASAISHRVEYFETSIAITMPGDNRTVLDETSTTAPEASNGAVDVRVKRTINANEWSTICLPFAMTETQVKAAFGDDVQLADFKGTDEPEYDESGNVVGVTANFENVQAIEANHPYIIKVSQPITEFTVDGVDIVADEDKAFIEFDNGLTGRPRVLYSGFYGTYHAQTTLGKFFLFLNDNKFWYSTGNTKMKAFRAYFYFIDILAEVKNADSNVKMSIGGEETRIDGLLPEKFYDSIYDLTGRKVEKAEKGIYIVNGKKVLK